MEHNPQHGLASFHTTSALSEFTKNNNAGVYFDYTDPLKGTN